MRRSGYLQRRDKLVQANKDAAAETYAQYMAECFALALNDPDVMGKDVLGEKRMLRVNAAAQRYFDEFHPALSTKPIADHYRDKLDERLQKIFRGSFMPFSKRYDWVSEIKTGRG